MGKKKKKAPKVWCFYCEREFEDEKILIQHQKAKHFKCYVCHKKLSSASGMLIHVLQVHKESVSKIPNAKPERESMTDLEIYGMEGIPADILAAHDGDNDEDENPSKVAKVEVPPSLPYVGGGMMAPNALGMAPQPMYTAMQPMYRASPGSGPRPPPNWLPQPRPPQMWRGPVPGQAGAPRMGQPPQPLFPIQGQRPPPPLGPSQPPSQPLFPIRPPLPPGSATPPPRPLFPVGQPTNGPPPPPPPPPPPTPPYSSSGPLVKPPPPSGGGNQSSLSGSPGLAPPFPPAGGSPAMSNSMGVSARMSPSVPNGGMSGPLPPPLSSHMYSSGPNTGGPSIGPPPVISNRPPGPAGVTNEVYLVWDDELFSMEERRASLQKYQAFDEAMQMSSVDDAIGKRILEGRLAGRMSFHV